MLSGLRVKRNFFSSPLNVTTTSVMNLKRKVLIPILSVVRFLYIPKLPMPEPDFLSRVRGHVYMLDRTGLIWEITQAEQKIKTRAAHLYRLLTVLSERQGISDRIGAGAAETFTGTGCVFGQSGNTFGKNSRPRG